MIRVEDNYFIVELLLSWTISRDRDFFFFCFFFSYISPTQKVDSLLVQRNKKRKKKMKDINTKCLDYKTVIIELSTKKRRRDLYIVKINIVMNMDIFLN